MSAGLDHDAVRFRAISGRTQVKELLLTALHYGRYQPGDRAPSVRRMALMTGMNRKTIHRAYQQMADEGLLRVKWGSGTYFTEDDLRVGTAMPEAANLLAAVERFRSEARALGLSEHSLARFMNAFLTAPSTCIPIAVCECNREQIGLIAEELSSALGCRASQVSIAEVQDDQARALAGVDAVITTDCHREDIGPHAASVRLPMYRVALSHDFTISLVRAAKSDPLLMVVSDEKYGPIFLGMLRRLSISDSTISNIRVVEPASASREAMKLNARGSVYVSPLLRDDPRFEQEIAGVLRCGLRPVQAGPYLSLESIERLRAQLAMQQASTGE